MGGRKRRGLWCNLQSVFSGFLGHPFSERSASIGLWARESLHRALLKFEPLRPGMCGLAESCQVIKLIFSVVQVANT